MNQGTKEIMPLLQTVLEVQELDMQMIRLMRLKRERQGELAKMDRIHSDLEKQIQKREDNLQSLRKEARLFEEEIELLTQMIKKLESQQSGIKRIEEFNALNHEITSKEKECTIREQNLSQLYDRIVDEEKILEELQSLLEKTLKENALLAEEISDGIAMINEEGKELLVKHQEIAQKCDPEIYSIYQRLLKNKQSRVIVPIENRACSGCHIILTAQDENMVRKGNRLVNCEHCSRILYLQEVGDEGSKKTAQRRRRRTTKV
ncbi:MAG: hypothetical protein KDK40_00980 [Chlamydiia bacterium]|nr:hypothetical protein [Chlamydiia bacterium]